MKQYYFGIFSSQETFAPDVKTKYTMNMVKLTFGRLFLAARDLPLQDVEGNTLNSNLYDLRLTNYSKVHLFVHSDLYPS
jgi:hypothetical protein